MQFGDYRVEIVPDAEFRLDGGAMFGVVPRALWSRPAPRDEERSTTERKQIAQCWHRQTTLMSGSLRQCQRTRTQRGR